MEFYIKFILGIVDYLSSTASRDYSNIIFVYNVDTVLFSFFFVLYVINRVFSGQTRAHEAVRDMGSRTDLAQLYPEVV